MELHPILRRRRLLLAGGALAVGESVLPAWSQTGSVAGAAGPVGARRPVLVGQSADLSSPLAPTIAPVLRGQKLALDDFNAKGGVAGRSVELVVLDDGFDQKRCVENVNRLIDEQKVTALFGLAASSSIAAVLPILAEKKVPLVGAYTGALQFRAKHHPYFFTCLASYSDELRHIVRNQKTLVRTRIALVYANSALGQPLVPILEEIVREEGVSLVAKVALEPNGSNAAHVAQQAMAGNPQALILVAFGPPIVPFVKAWKSIAGAPVYAISIANSTRVLEAIGDDSRGLAFTQLIPSTTSPTPLVQEFRAAAARAKIPGDRDQLLGYIQMRVFLDGLKRAGRDVNSQSLVTALESMNRVEMGGFRINYSPTNHHGSTFVDIVIVGSNGRLIS